MSRHHRRPHYNKGNSCNYVCIAFVPFSSLSLLLKYIDVDKYYLQKWPLPTQKLSRAHTHTHTPLSPERGVARQCGRLLDSEVRRCRGGAWPLEQPLWRLVRPPFRMSWMCWTIRLMATEGGRERRSESESESERERESESESERERERERER